MSYLIDKNKKKILPNQNRYLPIILWLFPLLLLNIGWYFFSYIDYSWIKSEWIEQSQREAESFAASSDFVYCMGKKAGNFFDQLKKDVDSFGKKKQKNELLENIASHAVEILKKPFPEHNLFVFRISADKNKTELVYHNVENLIGKRAIGFAFEYFAKTNLSDDNYKNNNKSGLSMAKTFLGSECDPSIIAKTQRGKVSYSIYNNKPHYFFWNYLKYEETGDIYGLFLLIENNVNAEIGSKLIALRELKNNSDGVKNKYGAFIPLFPGYGGVIANEEFAKMPEYKRLTREWVPKNIDDLYSWQFKDTSKLFEKTRVGNYQAFFHIMAGQSHAAVLLKPILDKAKLPFWLYFLNIVLISITMLLLIRGFIQGVWPNISLKIRFITTYFLAACMPLGLLIIASYGYISAYQHSAYFDKLSKLKFCINQFDIRKTQKQEDYKTAYLDILNDSNFQESIKRFDKANSNNPKEFPIEAKEVLNCALGILKKGSRDLPILSLTIIDERGNYFSNYYKNDCQIFNLLEGGGFSNKKDLSLEEVKCRDINEKSINILMYSFLKPMREKILQVASKTKKWDREYTPTLYQETASGGFKNAAGGRGDLSKVLDEHRNIIFDRLVGDRIISHIFDNIYINGIPRFVLFFTWDLAESDEETFRSSLNYFSIKEPDLVFFAFDSTHFRGNSKPWIDSGRHGRDFEKNSLELAKQAYFSGDIVSRRYETMSAIAVPSKKYKDKIIVGCVSHNDLKMPVFERKFVCATIIAIATIIFLFCIYYSFKIFLKPIGNLKQVLDKVADGNLDIEIKSSSKDEFGIMSREFSVMTRELSERNKLATLLSDHAVEALSKNEYAEGVNTDVEKFNGTALVTDIRNFTGMCEKYEPEQITDLLNEHFACMTKIFASNGGRIYKYIGDAIEVVFSDNDNFEKNSVERAFLASVQMLEALNKINNKRVSNNLFEYKIGVGLCYGSMYSGSIGSLETRLD
ncbi:MAG: adenylate/guanylate cyclase domain-containing protein, partial [Candidatus Riflebacteria bacterium]|nr:adenylate/guanylate cyclase domain-containing protein [Candidatus Riflebacteria bacterium]